jgi:hypothetical protein
MKRFMFAIMLFGHVCAMPADAAEYATARTATPVLNTPDFSAVFGGAGGGDLKTDRCGQVRELEYIALPGTVFSIRKKLRSGNADIYEVDTDDYAASPNVRLYVEGRFLKLEGGIPAPRTPALPSREQIITALRASVGAGYVWGGNVPNGVPELMTWFDDGVGKENRRRFTLAGLDCSGLLYHATGGVTPRNTSQLTTFGQGVDITGKPASEIAALLQPLDLIVWNGHVIIVIDRLTAIESRLACGRPAHGGVVLTVLTERIADLLRTRHPVTVWPEGGKDRDIFVVRRWYAGE